MTYYENEQLKAREHHLIGAGLTFIIASPVFGIIASVFLGSLNALYVGTAVSVLIGVLAIIGAIQARAERKHNKQA